MPETIRVRRCPASGGTLVEGTCRSRRQGPTGECSGWTWNGRELTAVTPRFGLPPLFVWQAPDGVALAHGLAELVALGAPTSTDDAALAVFLRLGYFVGEDTCLAGVKVLPPGGQLEWTPERGPVVRSTDRTVTLSSPQVSTRSAAVDAFVDRFRSAVGRSLPTGPAPPTGSGVPTGRCVLPLSGGRDSRHVLLELSRRAARPDLLVTGSKYPPVPPGDTVLPAELARRLRIPWTRVPVPRDRVRADLAAVRAQSLCSWEGSWLGPVLARLRGAHGYDGLAGDVLTGRSYRAVVAEAPWAAAGAPPTEAARGLLERGRYSASLDRLARSGARGRWGTDLAIERLAEEIDRHRETVSPWRSFVLWNRTRRTVGPAPGALAPGVVLRAPFLDDAVMDLLLSVPEALTFPNDRPGLHDEVLHRAYPAFADLPFDTGPVAGRGRGSIAQGTRLLDSCRHLAAVSCRLAVLSGTDPAWATGVEGTLWRLLRPAPGLAGMRRALRAIPLAIYLLELERLTHVSVLPPDKRPDTVSIDPDPTPRSTDGFDT